MARGRRHLDRPQAQRARHHPGPARAQRRQRDRRAEHHGGRRGHPGRPGQRPAARRRRHASSRSRCTLFAEVSATTLSGGAQLQLTNLGVAVSGASGGNAIASGMLKDSGSSGQKPQPAFSPGARGAEARHRPGRGHPAGRRRRRAVVDRDPEGLRPAVPRAGRLRRHHAAAQGRVDLAAARRRGSRCSGSPPRSTTCPITYFVVQRRLLRRRPAGRSTSAASRSRADIGRLSDRRRPAEERQRRERRVPRHAARPLRRLRPHDLRRLRQGRTATVSFFAIGAVIGPIGGPPAFFLTGIGGGFGINRRAGRADRPVAVRRLPADPGARHRRDAAGRPDGSSCAASATTSRPSRARSGSPPGISFNSFALVDGIAVVARAVRRRPRAQPARPGPHGAAPPAGRDRQHRARPARAVLLEGGRALGAGPAHRQLVAALPRRPAHRRLRLRHLVQRPARAASSCSRWAATTRTSTATATRRCRGSACSGASAAPSSSRAARYFALTSEARDGRRRRSRRRPTSAGPGPGCRSARTASSSSTRSTTRSSAYARIAAGITIDTWFGDITFSISCGAELNVEGPDFHGRATFDVGPCDVVGAVRRRRRPRRRRG